MFRRKFLAFILLFFFIFMSMPVRAFDTTQMLEGLYIYDEAIELNQDVEDVLRTTLIEFEVQTDIRVVLLTFKEGKVNDLKKNIKEICGGNEVVIAFSKSQKTIICSDTEVDISKYLKNILSTSTESEYSEFVENTVLDILNEISVKEKKSFEPVREENHLIDFVAAEDINSLRHIVTMASIGLIALLVAVIIAVKIFKLCIREIRENFFCSRFE